MLWEVDILPAKGQPDTLARGIRTAARALGISEPFHVESAHGYLIEGAIERADIERAARELLADAVVERFLIGALDDARLATGDAPCDARLIHVLPKPGVMDPVAQSTKAALADLSLPVAEVRTFKKYWFQGLPDAKLRVLIDKLLANDAIEQVVHGPLRLQTLALATDYEFERIEVPIRDLDDASLERLSRQRQLYLSLAEMRTIQAHFREIQREPTDAELETIAQTWSEHCSHKTLKGRITYRDPQGERRFENLLKETVFAATFQIRQNLGQRDWCVSVFEDNAGVIRFDDQFNLAFKVETHNHPSALEPYGGANTGLGGVIRDCLGTGLGAKPICNTDVFCFAPPDTPFSEVPPGALHPRRVIEGVVAGVRDYGNRMGIPTVNGAIYFDRRYLGNPLVYCGNIGLIPRDKSTKQPRPGDYIIAIGGRTGRDGIHGATFSSAELTHESETVSGGAVQIGNAIAEKMLTDVILQARDRELFTAITDCGAGGFSSAVGEMGAEIGAEVQLDRIPLKYAGLSYAEAWISEAQERMVLAVRPACWPELQALCASEGVEATRIGTFAPTGRLRLTYQGHEVADLSMQFLHHGRPPIVREAIYQPERIPLSPLPQAVDYASALFAILKSPNVASKHWVIRQYDHEVQGGSVVKPLVGACNDGPSDAAVLCPVLGSRRALVVACGMNPRYGDLDTYDMAASAIDEAIRNCVAVGADPDRIALLDNFCWGNTDRPETLGSLVRAALACHDVAIAYGAPFISGKDSLNNEFSYQNSHGSPQKLVIPPSLLISALGQMADAARAVTMDFKEPGNFIYQLGLTRDELGGSHFALVQALTGGQPPRVDPVIGRRTFAALHRAITSGLVRACHDLSEGGLAAAVAEMAFAGNLGASIALAAVPSDVGHHALSPGADFDTILLFSESNSRFLCEVRPENAAALEALLADVPHARIGAVTSDRRLKVTGALATAQNGSPPLLIDAEIDALKEAWQAPLNF
jgi:phosphoribosylformylglycinamidine synthase